MKKIIFSLSFFILSACTLRASFAPEGGSLNDAVVGIPYNEKIKIIGSAVSSLDENGKERFVGEIIPNNVGLYLQYCNNSPANNCVQVKGTPIKSGIVKIELSGVLYGTNIAAGSGFDKTYIITVKNLE
ncbi:hypothetical protein JE939_002825 [Yersinia ruckeri]|nr:hypothetical protein [Yersinia ruckeri]